MCYIIKLRSGFMGKEVLGKCPVCNGDTIVTKICCENCNTTIEGEFTLCKFCRLTSEQKQFIDTFIFLGKCSNKRTDLSQHNQYYVNYKKEFLLRPNPSYGRMG